MLSDIEHIARKMERRWVPKWRAAFVDQERGGFHERLNRSFQPIDTGYRRLVTQCRQLGIYSHAGAPDDFLRTQFDYIVDHYHVSQSGGWVFSMTPDGKACDDCYDFYGHAFVIFALCQYFKATQDERAQDLALQTLHFIDRHFRLEDKPGFAESLNHKLEPIKKVRRQDPHMHLFEACLFAYDTWGTSGYLDMAREMYDLFNRYFYDERSGTLTEYFDEDLKPHKDEGHIIQPGHHGEWVWLLFKYAALAGDTPRMKTQRDTLLDFANTHGWDRQWGGIYDAVDRQGKVIKDTKRIWPFAEVLKANALMLDHAQDRDGIKKRMKAMIRVFAESYMQERGFWTEWLRRDLVPDTNYMPGTTPYHLYFGIVETLDTLKARGKSKSLRSRLWGSGYALRRKLAARFREFWDHAVLGKKAS